jgi:hypothetical protein
MIYSVLVEQADLRVAPNCGDLVVAADPLLGLPALRANMLEIKATYFYIENSKPL